MPIITPRASATQSPPVPTSGNNSARERAIARLSTPPTAANVQEHPVANANAISAEELGAIRQSAPESEGRQSDISEALASKDSATSPADTKAKDEPLSSQYAVLARKEKQLRAKAQAQESAFKAREDALKAREEAVSKHQGNPEPVDMTKHFSKEEFMADPISFLVENGFTQEQFAQWALNPIPQQDPQTKAYLAKLEAKVKALESGQEETQKSVKEQQTKAYDNAVNQIRIEVKSLVAQDPEFETIKATGSDEEVVDLIKRTFEQDGELLTVHEAAKQIEEYLVEEVLKLHKVNKIQQKLKPAAPAPAPEAKNIPQASKTLTNGMGGTKPLSAKERAVLAFKGQLK